LCAKNARNFDNKQGESTFIFVSEDQKTNYFLLSLVSMIAIFIVLSIVLGILFTTIGFPGYRAVGL